MMMWQWWVDKWVVSCNQMVATTSQPSGACLRGERQVWCICRVKAVWSIHERFSRRGTIQIMFGLYLFGWCRLSITLHSQTGLPALHRHILGCLVQRRPSSRGRGGVNDVVWEDMGQPSLPRQHSAWIRQLRRLQARLSAICNTCNFNTIGSFLFSAVTTTNWTNQKRVWDIWTAVSTGNCLKFS